MVDPLAGYDMDMAIKLDYFNQSLKDNFPLGFEALINENQDGSLQIKMETVSNSVLKSSTSSNWEYGINTIPSNSREAVFPSIAIQDTTDAVQGVSVIVTLPIVTGAEFFNQGNQYDIGGTQLVFSAPLQFKNITNQISNLDPES